MKGKLLLTILISLFIGLFLTDFVYKNLIKEPDKEILLSWDLYKENIDKVNTFIESFDPNMNYYGIYSKPKTNVYDLSKEEKTYILYNYLIENRYIKDDFLNERDFKEISNMFYKEVISFNTLSINSTLELVKKEKGYLLEQKEGEEDSTTYFVINNGVKSAYQLGDIIYFDINVTFAKKEITNTENYKYSYSLSPKFDSIICEGNNCEREMKSVIYRVTLKNRNDSYYFDNAVVLGSE